MARPAALGLALSLADYPVRVKYVSRLPDGVLLLLQIAADETEALRAAQAITGRSQTALREAAAFFIEQVLFHKNANSYRVLGASPGASRSELRRNMALLIKWLHPDSPERRASQCDLDRGVFIHRVTQAWENLKTEERRAAYDRSLTERRREPSRRQAARPLRKDRRRPAVRRRAMPSEQLADEKPITPRLVVYRFDRGTVWSRLLTYLWTRT